MLALESPALKHGWFTGNSLRQNPEVLVGSSPWSVELPGWGISFISPCPLTVSLNWPRLFIFTPYIREASINAVKMLVCSRGVASPAEAAGASLFNLIQPMFTWGKCGSSAGIAIPKHSLAKLLHVRWQLTPCWAASVISWSRYWPVTKDRQWFEN